MRCYQSHPLTISVNRLWSCSHLDSNLHELEQSLSNSIQITTFYTSLYSFYIDRPFLLGHLTKYSMVIARKQFSQVTLWTSLPLPGFAASLTLGKCYFQPHLATTSSHFNNLSTGLRDPYPNPHGGLVYHDVPLNTIAGCIYLMFLKGHIDFSYPLPSFQLFLWQ